MYILFFDLVLEGYVKTNLYEAFNDKLNKYIGYGSITDGFYKLEIHVKNFSQNEFFEQKLNKGDKIEVIGIMQTNGNSIILIVNYKIIILV